MNTKVNFKNPFPPERRDSLHLSGLITILAGILFMKSLILTFIHCFTAFFILAQEQADSLLRVYERLPEDSNKVNTMLALVNAYLYNDGVQAFYYGQEALRLSEEIGYKTGLARSLYLLGTYYYVYDQMDSAGYYYNQALDRFINLNNQSYVADANHGLALIQYSTGQYHSALNMLDRNITIYTGSGDSVRLAITHDLKGMIHTFQGNYHIALNETLTALKILENSDNPVRLADALNHLAGIEFHLGNYGKSIGYNLKALDIYIHQNDMYFQAQAYNDIGNTYYYLARYQEAIEALEKCVALTRDQGIPELEATALNNLGKTYTALELHEEAVKLLNEGLEIVEVIENPNKVVEALLGLGEVYTKMNQPEKALAFYSRAISLAESIGVKNNLRASYYGRSQAHERMTNFQAALTDYQHYSTLSDSLLNEKRSRQIEELRTIYETEKKEQQIALRDKEIYLLNQEARIRLLQIISLSCGFMLMVLAFYGVRQKLKRNNLEKEKVEAELAFKKKELTTHALHLAKKNEVLEGLKQKAQVLKATGTDNSGYQQLIRTINFDLHHDHNWENFSRYFEQVHKDFNSRVKTKYPEVTTNEIRLLALLKMNLSSKEIANILNISGEGIKKARYRLRKKLMISSDDSLQDVAINL